MARCGEGLARLGYAIDRAWEKGKRGLGTEGPGTVKAMPWKKLSGDFWKLRKVLFGNFRK
uniref:Uncharacterized protein n=4 Tax=Oryza TaxID=4527 RepID=Q10GN5_ORYSJ|nr:hypothetical protein LOC_Os03g42284 [Oryza sativa Japonica Group]